MSEKLIPHGHSRVIRASALCGLVARTGTDENLLSRVECQLGRKSKMRCRTGACMCGCGNETRAFACLGGDSTLLFAATAGHKSKGGRLTAG